VTMRLRFQLAAARLNERAASIKDVENNHGRTPVR
jgi:hypothetical protein